MSLRQRITERIATWAERRHGTDTLLLIHRRRVYILPTRMGFLYAAGVFGMIVGGMNYNNNVALLMAFALTARGLLAMHQCHRNLLKLSVTCRNTEPTFAGDTASFAFVVDNPSGRQRRSIVFETGPAKAASSATTHVAEASSSTVTLSCQTEGRGWFKLPRVNISTTYPLGLFRAWTIARFDQRCLVYPKPTSGQTPHPQADSATSTNRSRGVGDSEFSHLRPFRNEDSPHRIAWKAYAKDRSLLVQQYDGYYGESYLLRWDSLPGLDTERRLAVLCRWVIDLNVQGLHYGLALPSCTLLPTTGLAHYHTCLRQLALFGFHDD